jgi:PAN domain
MQHAGSKLGYGVYQNLTVDYKTMCLRSCMNDINCDSVNYSPRDMSCQLIKQNNAAIVNSADLIEDSNWEWWCNQYTYWN